MEKSLPLILLPRLPNSKTKNQTKTQNQRKQQRKARERERERENRESIMCNFCLDYS